MFFWIPLQAFGIFLEIISAKCPLSHKYCFVLFLLRVKNIEFALPFNFRKVHMVLKESLDGKVIIVYNDDIGELAYQ